MSRYLMLPAVMNRIRQALEQQKAFSLVRIGDGENIVLAQKSVWSLDRVLREPWVKKSRSGQKGITLPNIKIRDEIVQSIKEASIVGILPKNDRMIKAPDYLKRSLTDQVFRFYKLAPGLTCHACVNRMMSRRSKFFEFLRGYRIMIINKNPNRIRSILESPRYNLNVTETIRFSDYKQINQTLTRVAVSKDNFDIALISCGVNAVILAPKIARLTGKVAIDFGKAPKFIRR